LTFLYWFISCIRFEAHCMQKSLYLWLSFTHIAKCICRTVPLAPDINWLITSSWRASGCPIDWDSCIADNGYRVFPGGKEAAASLWPPTPTSAKVKERVELYFYSTSGHSWPVDMDMSNGWGINKIWRVRSDAHSHSHKWRHAAAAVSANNVLRNSYNTRPLLCARITCYVTVITHAHCCACA
jgi:hypothetical protein